MFNYKIQVFDESGTPFDAYLEKADRQDLTMLSSRDLTCNWEGFWNHAAFECEAIIKLHCQGNILGLIHFAVYPYPFLGDAPEYLEILHLECVPKTRRRVHPVGFWLLWYAVTTGIKICTGESDGTLIRLDSLEDAIPYYRDKVMMEELGWTTIAPGEDGYAFRFTEEQAKSFDTRIRQEYGTPVCIN